MADVAPATPTPTPSSKPKKPHSENNQAEANEIEQAKEMLTTAKGDAAILAALTPRGYDAAKLDEVLGLQATADAAYGGRASAKGAGEGASQAVKDARKLAETPYAKFRDIARKLYKSDGDQTTLGLKGKIADDLQIFIKQATDSYTAAKKAPYAAVLATNGYPAAKLDAEITRLGALSTLASTNQGAKGSGKQSTTDRETAYNALHTWMAIFKGVAEEELTPAQLTELKM